MAVRRLIRIRLASKYRGVKKFIAEKITNPIVTMKPNPIVFAIIPNDRLSRNLNQSAIGIKTAASKIIGNSQVGTTHFQIKTLYAEKK